VLPPGTIRIKYHRHTHTLWLPNPDGFIHPHQLNTSGTDLRFCKDTPNRIRVYRLSQSPQTVAKYDHQSTSIQSDSKLPYLLCTDSRIEISLRMMFNIDQINSQMYQYQSHLDMNMRSTDKYVIVIRNWYQQWCKLNPTAMQAGLIATNCLKRSTDISQQRQQSAEHQFSCQATPVDAQTKHQASPLATVSHFQAKQCHSNWMPVQHCYCQFTTAIQARALCFIAIQARAPFKPIHSKREVLSLRSPKQEWA